MSFLGGALVGCVVGLAVGAILARQRRGPGADDAARAEPHRPARSRSDLGAAAIVIAALALAASGVALARSDGHTAATAAAPTSTATTTIPTPTQTATAATGPTSTTSAAALEATVAVPNVVSQARATAEAMLKNAGLKVSVETLSLSNVPAGFVISQSPLPAALVTAGSTVSLVVSAAT